MPKTPEQADRAKLAQARYAITHPGYANQLKEAEVSTFALRSQEPESPSDETAQGTSGTEVTPQRVDSSGIEIKPAKIYSSRDPKETHMSALRKGIQDVMRDAAPGMIVSWLSQEGLLELEQAVNRSLNPTAATQWTITETAKNLLRVSPFSWGNHEFLANIGINIVDTSGFVVGGWIGEQAIKAKMKTEVGRQPQNPLLLKLWQTCIMTEFASLGIAGVKTVTHVNDIITHALNQFSTHPEFALGGFAATVGGILSTIDNIRPTKDITISNRELLLPIAAMALGITGFVCSPPELKPIAAGYTVSTIANFLEKTAEFNRRGGKK